MFIRSISVDNCTVVLLIAFQQKGEYVSLKLGEEKNLPTRIK